MLDGQSAILSIELHTILGKDVAHLTMRDIKQAVGLKKWIEEQFVPMQMRAQPYGMPITVKAVHGAPRKASKRIWIGNLPHPDDTWFLQPMEKLLWKFGKLVPQPKKVDPAKAIED